MKNNGTKKQNFKFGKTKLWKLLLKQDATAIKVFDVHPAFRRINKDLNQHNGG